MRATGRNGSDPERNLIKAPSIRYKSTSKRHFYKVYLNSNNINNQQLKKIPKKFAVYKKDCIFTPIQRPRSLLTMLKSAGRFIFIITV
jgi:hypothetical protein